MTAYYPPRIEHRDRSAAALDAFHDRQTPTPTGADSADRETWLYRLADELRPLIAEHGATCPPLRIGVGFTSTGRRSPRVGECWSAEASTDGTHAIFLHPGPADAVTVAGILLHEMIHAAVGLDAKHGAPFRRLATACGLEGKMTATTTGPALTARLHALTEQLGPYPHAALSAAHTGPPKQSTRMVKVECPECGYVARTTRKWLDDVGAPLCPADMLPMEEPAP